LAGIRISAFPADALFFITFQEIHLIVAVIIDSQEKHDKFFFGQKYFAFLDVLGFSDFIRFNSHATIRDTYDALINTPVNAYNEIRKSERPAAADSRGVDDLFGDLQVINISDSIILWTENSKPEAITGLLHAVKLFMTISLKLGMPLRGAVSYGDIEVFRNKDSVSLVGKPIVYAVDKEKAQQWSGCIVEPGIITYLQSYNKIYRGIDVPPVIARRPKLLIEYDVPVKNDGKIETKKGWAINWTDDKNITEKTIRDSFAAHNKKIEKAGNKIDATVAFFNYCRAYKYPDDIQVIRQ
jgi:hypothetical protein